MAQQPLATLSDGELVNLINNRWNSSESIWKVVKDAYKNNVAMYDMEYGDKDRMPEYIKRVANSQFKVRSNRIFSNVEAVINSLIANPPKPTILPGRDTPQSIELAQLQEQYFINKYDELNVKETIRKGLRNLYFGRLIVIKPYWNHKTNDFDCITIDPRKVRFARYSTKEVESEFAIEEVTDTLEALIARFPKKKADIIKQSGLSEDQIQVQNPQVTYKEAWIKDRVIFTYNEIVLGNIRNPYWDWDGLLTTNEEAIELSELGGDERKAMLDTIRQQQPDRQVAQQVQNTTMTQGGESNPTADPNAAPQAPQPNPVPQQVPPDPNADFSYLQTENQTEQQTFAAYKFNHFDAPRKPYIFATVLNNENTPVGRTDFIGQATPLQEAVDRRKRQLDDNAEMMNGLLKVDSEVMSKEDAQKMRYETTGVVWGKGVKEGVTRETGVGLPQFIFEDMQDSRQEIDNIMAASSAFRGERQGQETKAGRLALIQQSALRLNELVQVVDYVNSELFNWFYQLAKVRYTETHYAKDMGDDKAVKIMELIQDDFEDGTEVRMIPGRTLPEDNEFKYERAQEDIKLGVISPIDYLRETGHQNPTELAKNAVIYKLSPVSAVGLTPEEMQKIPPPLPVATLREQVAFNDLPADAKSQVLARMGIQVEPQQIIAEGNPSPVSIAFTDLPPDGQVQAAAKAGITLDPHILMAERAVQDHKQQLQDEQKNQQFQANLDAKTQAQPVNNKKG